MRVEELRKKAEESFKAYCCIVAPHILWGSIHYEIMDWIQKDGLTTSKLLLIPRAHLKSTIMALYTCWRIVNKPSITILYLSAGDDLIRAQLRAIKSTLERQVHRQLWPQLLHIQENKREKWTSKHIAVDHPERKKQGVRDNTVSGFTIGSNFVGLHYDLCVFDDIVVLSNSQTAEQREKVATSVGMVTSILNSGGEMIAAGTIYHPSDIYATWESMELPVMEEQEDGTWVQTHIRKRWDVFRRVVEENNVFLWPRKTVKGITEGFDPNVLAEKKADLLLSSEGIVQFFCQYYLDPNANGETTIKRSMFKYYRKQGVKYEGDRYCINGTPLKIVGGWDFAEGLTAKHDYSVLVICGITADNIVYILDIHRYKASSASDHFKWLQKSFQRWGVKRVYGEKNRHGKVVIDEINKLCRKNWVGCKVEGVTHTSYDGSKEERIANVLNHRYVNESMRHPKGNANTPNLEDELVHTRPKHDDIKDALATCLESAKPPPKQQNHHLAGVKRDHMGGALI